jgi:predicted nuclease of predicted toxin-antitoxin system
MKFIIDMNLSPRWVDVLNDAGIEAIHWSSVGGADATDSAIMTYAVTHGGVVLTHDLDFGAILAATGGASPSVVQLRADDISPGAIGPRVIQALRQMASELERGALLTVEPGRARVRLLPLPAP